MMDIKSKTLTFHEARRPWDEWGIRETLGSVNPSWRNCTPSDIDSVIELNGYFLFIEDKPLDERYETAILDGQMRMYQNLLALSEKVTVWILVGSRDKPAYLYSVRRGETITLHGDPQLVIDRIRQWAEFVNKQLKGF